MREIAQKSLRYALAFAMAAGALVCAGQAFAQQKDVQRNQVGPTEVTVDTRNTTVAHVEGDYLVVRLQDGMLEAMRIPSGERFDIDGESLTLDQLKPGMLLTRETITTTRPIVVKTVEVTDGTVFFVIGQRLGIKTEDGKVVDYTIPEWAKITIGGEEVPLHQLRRGNRVTATFTTEEPMTVGELEVRSHGHRGVTEPKEVETKEEVKPEVAPEVTRTEQPRVEQPAETPSEEVVSEKLPKTGSELPLVGLLGALALAASFCLSLARKVL